jgi:DNA-binding NtrC family response regulator
VLSQIKEILPSRAISTLLLQFFRSTLQCNCMIQVFHPDDLDPKSAECLARAGLITRPFSGTQVVELTHATADHVYLVPETMMLNRSWARLRVNLSQGNRLYICCLQTSATRNVVRALREGCYDAVTIDDQEERWREAFLGAVENQRLWLQLYGGKPLNEKEVLLGRSAAMQGLRQAVKKLGATDVCVLILGESGVGKERVASALHEAGRGGSFVALNCAAIPKDLLESELFGVEKGAFTGALKSRPGLVEQAAGGTLFLDEIGEMDLSVQPKLLRFLETRRARRVGGESEYKVKARVVSATNRNLEVEIAEKRFRADLFYRIAEITLQPPPLRARPDDIPELAQAFVREANERFGKNFEIVEPGLVQRFQQHTWPGNVRELKSTISRLILLHDGPVLRSSWWDLPQETPAAPPVQPGPQAQTSPALPHPGALPSRKGRFALAKRLLEESGNDYTWVAGQLGINPSTLWRWRDSGRLG